MPGTAGGAQLAGAQLNIGEVLQLFSQVAQAASVLRLRAHAGLPADTRLWAALQAASGGPWAGCIYDVDRIIDVIEAGLSALEKRN